MSKAGFIVFEGLDGSGKGTQISMLTSRLESEGVTLFTTCEPTQFSTGGLIRDALGGLTKRSPSELAALFLADRISHCAVIKKMLGSGRTVICDRYYYSSFAYQGMDTDLRWVMDSNLNCPDIIKPDMCLFLDVPPEVCDHRIEAGRASREIYEAPEAIKKIRAKYMDVFSLLPDHNIRLINAARSAQDVASDVYEAVAQVIKSK